MDAGLAEVVAAETVLSDVDGAAGRLVIRGFDVGVLAQRAAFEDVAALLWDGFLPRVRDLPAAFGAARVRMFARLPDFGDLDDVEALRAALARVRDGDDLGVALDLAAMSAVATAAIARTRRGRTLIAPDPSLSQAGDCLRMMLGRDPAPAETSALDAYWATVCDHGLNASTFAARVVASTQAGLASAVIGGLCALKGPLHGGAPGPVLDMLDAIGAPENAEAWIDAALARGERLMGFGHRIYRVRDPRAEALAAALRRLPRAAGRIAFAEAIEKTALTQLRARYSGRALDTNVEYYTALLLDALGAPRETFTCLFACGRVLGWIAHAREQVMTRRIVRPQSRYVGPAPDAEAA
ncbi:MAG: citrate synthase [Alphaproteobacteria bacterium]|nr:citrate synthase [Alphaproteobacteria bacterium]